MKIDVDIMTRMHSGHKEFVLQSRFSSTDRAVVLFGPSGSGKTLTLKAIAGLLTPGRGRIAINGDLLFHSKTGVDLPTRSRGVGYVFQDYALFPHRTVRENVAFGLTPLFRRIGRKDAGRVDDLLGLFGLEGLADLKPSALSGGQQQRTALARALATRPRILLLDEPFSALDQPLRLRMREELGRIMQNFDVPMIMVTHDADEVESFAETVVVYRDGHVVGIHSASRVALSGQSLSQTVRDEIAQAYSA